MPVFVDTNVLVYARDGRDPAKHERANTWMRHLWRSGEGRLSTQILQEFYTTVTRKLSSPLDPAEARGEVAELFAWHPFPITEATLMTAFGLEDEHSISFWDALVVAAADLVSCDRLLTEDLQHGSRIGGVTIVDPFVAAPGD